MNFPFAVFVLLGTLLCACVAQIPNFTNPIIDNNSGSPSILKGSGNYYLTFDFDSGTEIVIYKSPYFTHFRYAEQRTIYKAPSGYNQLRGSNMKKVEGQLVIYFSMRNETHKKEQIYAMTAHDPEDPFGNWSLPQRLMEHIWSQNSHHGSVMKHGNKLYFVFTSKHPETGHPSIYIASMANPTKVLEPVVLIKSPTEASWECAGRCANEAPSFLYNRGITYLIYSAGSSSDPGYCLSYMAISSGKDPLNISNWIRTKRPVFSKNEQANISSTGHASFTTSPDGTETWMIYQAAEPNATERKIAMAQRISWDKDNGTPIFPRAASLNTPQPRPSGEPEMFVNPILDTFSPDPGVLRLGDYYYLAILAEGAQAVQILKSEKLTNFRDAERAIVIRLWRMPGYAAILNYKLQVINKELYLYCSVYDGTSTMYRPYVFKAENASDPMGAWGAPVNILESIWPSDSDVGIVMTHNQQLYFVWASAVSTNLSLYIAPMSSPTEVAGPVTLLREAREGWECYGRCNVNSPFSISRNGSTFLFFTASLEMHSNCSISYMSIESGRDPLDLVNWYSAPEPVFTRNDEESVFGVGQATFTSSPDGSETWMVYHATDNETYIGDNRISRIERIRWSEVDGRPIFPKPHGPNHPQPVPSSVEKPAGHASFTTSSDGRETWMAYVAADSPHESGEMRNVSIEKITNAGGTSASPKPHGVGSSEDIPASQK